MNVFKRNKLCYNPVFMLYVNSIAMKVDKIQWNSWFFSTGKLVHLAFPTRGIAGTKLKLLSETCVQ